MHSSVHAIENLLFVTLLQLIVMIAAARLGNQLLRALGQPGVTGPLLRKLLPSAGYVIPVGVEA